MIRDKIKQRQRRFDRLWALERLIVVAEDEDRWDRMMQMRHGIEDEVGEKKGMWVEEVKKALRTVSDTLEDARTANAELALKMIEIVEKEALLVQAEMESTGKGGGGR